MNMSTSDAINNLQNLINSSLRAGVFSDTKSVAVIQESLDTLVTVINHLSEERQNGRKKEEKEFAEGSYD